MYIHILILNYNGRRLLGECLPSILAAAEASRHRCEVMVIDNDSTDDSVAWLADHFPGVRIVRQPNRALCSFNDVVPALEGPVAILLNNDVKLDKHCIDPLVEPLLDECSPCFMTAPLCRRFDGTTYEGFRTAVRWRWGLVQATALYPGHEATIDKPGLTASAGAVMAVDRRKFAALGGFDPLYLPGRLEDLDFAFRGYQAGLVARYVPESVTWHRGMATFGDVFGADGCDRLALRNTLLFQWKNLRHPRHVARQLFCLPVRLAWDWLRAPWATSGRRWAFTRALFGAVARLGSLRTTPFRPGGTIRREHDFFRRFDWKPKRAWARDTAANSSSTRAFPLSRWYVCPAADWLAARLTRSPLRPGHLTACGLIAAVVAAVMLLWRPEAAPAAAIFVLLAWFFDRADGLLARRQRTASAWGAWLDANVDELVDVGLHVAVAAAAASLAGSAWPWGLLIAFLAGKYLFMHGLAMEQEAAGWLGQSAAVPQEMRPLGAAALYPSHPSLLSRLRRAYHLPGNADVRVHLLVAALLGGWLVAELALVAAYYNLRWIARYVLVARRLKRVSRLREDTAIGCHWRLASAPEESTGKMPVAPALNATAHPTGRQ